MSITTAFRFALAAATVGATLCAAATAAHAKPRRLVVLEFDGPRADADAGRQTVLSMLGEDYDVVATKRWADARAQRGHNQHGAQTFSKAAKDSGVDAVVEGWVQDEGSYKMLSVLVRDAHTGSEIDQVSVKLGKNGITDAGTLKLRTELDDLLDWVQPGVEVPELPSYSSRDLERLSRGSTSTRASHQADDEVADDHTAEGTDDEALDPPRRARRTSTASRAGIGRPSSVAVDGRDLDADADAGGGTGAAITHDAAAAADADADGDDGATSRKQARVRTAAATGDNEALVPLFGENSVETDTILGAPAKHVPVQTPRFIIEGGAYYSSRTLSVENENNDAQQYQGVGSKGVSFKVAAYPFPHQTIDGVVSGLGFSGEVWKSPASTVSVTTDAGVVENHFDYGGWDAAAHYRQPLSSMLTIDGEAGYGQEHYTFENDIQLDVPDTSYRSFHAGGELDLAITEHATVGVGAKYHYVVDSGDLMSTQWYGPGTTSGVTLDGNFSIPLPRRLFVKGDFAYRRYSTTFDSQDVGAESALSAHDSTVAATVHMGIAF